MDAKRVNAKPVVSRKFEAILDTVCSLRPMPVSVTRVLNILDDPCSTAATIAFSIGLDQVLAAQVLRLANSASMGYGQACAALNDAVMRIGFERLRTLVMAAGVTGALSKRLVGYHLGDEYLWHHSLSVAKTTLWLGRQMRYPEPEEAYVAGLLHDMGKLVLDHYMRAEYRRAMEMVLQGRGTLSQIEERLFGIDHGGGGGLMASRWNFPVALTDAICFHHAPSLARIKQQLAALVNTANAIAPEYRSSVPDRMRHAVHPESLLILHVDEEQIKSMQEEVHAAEQNAV